MKGRHDLGAPGENAIRQFNFLHRIIKVATVMLYSLSLRFLKRYSVIKFYNFRSPPQKIYIMS